MADEPVSDNKAGDLLDAAERALGTARGKTTRADTALTAARKCLQLLKLGLIAAGIRAEEKD